MNIVLIGFMCSGKSRVGEALAKKLQWPHFDTDEMIVKDVGASIAEIIRKQGEPAFREVESKAVQLVSIMNKAVISTGGGVPLNPANMSALMLRGELVWLKIKPETVLKRAGNLKSRPLIDPNNPLESIKTRMTEREKFYSVARHQIDVEDQTPQELADKILGMLPSVAA